MLIDFCMVVGAGGTVVVVIVRHAFSVVINRVEREKC